MFLCTRRCANFSAERAEPNELLNTFMSSSCFHLSSSCCASAEHRRFLNALSAWAPVLNRSQLYNDELNPHRSASEIELLLEQSRVSRFLLSAWNFPCLIPIKENLNETSFFTGMVEDVLIFGVYGRPKGKEEETNA